MNNSLAELKEGFEILLLTYAFVLPVAYFSTYILALPVIILLRRYKVLNIISLLTTGAVAGAFTTYLIFIFIYKNTSFTNEIFGANVLIGVITAYVFALISGIARIPFNKNS